MNSWKHSALRMPSSLTCRPQVGQRSSLPRSALETVSVFQMASQARPLVQLVLDLVAPPDDIVGRYPFLARTMETPAWSQPLITSGAGSTARWTVPCTSRWDRIDRAASTARHRPGAR